MGLAETDRNILVKYRFRTGNLTTSEIAELIILSYADIVSFIDKLLRFSRKDKLVSRIMENIVPIAQDDDVLSLSADLRFHSVISGLSNTLWKIAVASPIYLSKE